MELFVIFYICIYICFTYDDWLLRIIDLPIFSIKDHVNLQKINFLTEIFLGYYRIHPEVHRKGVVTFFPTSEQPANGANKQRASGSFDFASNIHYESIIIDGSSMLSRSTQMHLRNLLQREQLPWYDICRNNRRFRQKRADAPISRCYSEVRLGRPRRSFDILAKSCWVTLAALVSLFLLHVSMHITKYPFTGPVLHRKRCFAAIKQVNELRRSKSSQTSSDVRHPNIAVSSRLPRRS